jgi:hypothetical protein
MSVKKVAADVLIEKMVVIPAIKRIIENAIPAIDD